MSQSSAPAMLTAVHSSIRQVVTLPTGVTVPANFGGESRPSPNPKDKDETAFHDQVCAGRLTRTAARIQLRDRWLWPYPTYKA